MAIELQLSKLNTKNQQYNTVPIVNNTVLYIYKFMKRVDFILCSYHNKRKILKEVNFSYLGPRIILFYKTMII